MSVQTNISYLSKSIPSTISNPIGLTNTSLLSTSSIYDGITKANKSISDQLKQSKNGIKKDQAIQLAKQFLPISGDLAIVSGLSYTLSSKLSNIFINDSKIQTLVKNANKIIDSVKTKNDIESAKVSRTTALNAISDSESHITNLRNIFSSISLLTNTFQVIVSTLSSLPIPSSTPPGIGVPIGVIIIFGDQLKKAKEIIAGFSIILSITTLIINQEITNLNNYRTQLKEVGTITDNSIASGNLSSQDLNQLINPGYNQLGTVAGVNYKGFTFAIKEENNSQYVVEGYKRRYAIAINSVGSISLIGESSFTLDPTVLISELELIIDAKNLKG